MAKKEKKNKQGEGNAAFGVNGATVANGIANGHANGNLNGKANDGGAALRLGKDCDYERELRRLQVELVKLQEWIRHEGLRVVVLFEGRDAAGKGGAIKRIAESLNPGFAGSRRWPRRRSARRRSGISRDTWRICRRRARWCCSTGAGITARAWST